MSRSSRSSIPDFMRSRWSPDLMLGLRMSILLPLILSGLSGFVGQIFGTIGFYYLDAPRGSLVTASRILFAGILGVSLFADPLTLKILLGGACIVFSLVGVSGVIEMRRVTA